MHAIFQNTNGYILFTTIVMHDNVHITFSFITANGDWIEDVYLKRFCNYDHKKSLYKLRKNQKTHLETSMCTDGLLNFSHCCCTILKH